MFSHVTDLNARNKILPAKLLLIMCASVRKKNARTLFFMHQGLFRPKCNFNTDAYCFRAKIFPLIFLIKILLTSTSPGFWVLNYEKQNKEGTCKISGRSFLLSAFYADFCICPISVIISTLTKDFFCRYPFVGPSTAKFLL